MTKVFTALHNNKHWFTASTMEKFTEHFVQECGKKQTIYYSENMEFPLEGDRTLPALDFIPYCFEKGAQRQALLATNVWTPSQVGGIHGEIMFVEHDLL